MKGFIEVNLKHKKAKVLINLQSITDLCVDEEDNVFIGFVSGTNDVIQVKETYEEIKELIKKAQ